MVQSNGFNTQPPEGGWIDFFFSPTRCVWVSTHSRPKAAGIDFKPSLRTMMVSTHSRPKAAGPTVTSRYHRKLVSTHSRPKAAGLHTLAVRNEEGVSTHSRPKAAGHTHLERKAVGMFQHTAARRRLDIRILNVKPWVCFNTQPPEGGWKSSTPLTILIPGFNTQPPEGGWQRLLDFPSR